MIRGLLFLDFDRLSRHEELSMGDRSITNRATMVFWACVVNLSRVSARVSYEMWVFDFIFGLLKCLHCLYAHSTLPPQRHVTLPTREELSLTSSIARSAQRLQTLRKGVRTQDERIFQRFLY